MGKQKTKDFDCCGKKSKDCVCFGQGTKDFAFLVKKRSIILVLAPKKKDFGPFCCFWEEVEVCE